MVIRIVLVLLGVWLALAIVGLLFKTLFWLAIIGVVAFVATTAFGLGKRTNSLGRRNDRAL